jgi:hypothetical protein
VDLGFVVARSFRRCYANRINLSAKAECGCEYAGVNIMKLHPNITRDRAQELTVNMALALKQKTEKNPYSREEGYGVCNRLEGFGLVHEVEVQTRELPLTNYAFRLSVQGLRLLKLLGETVPNYEHYFKEY